MLGFVMLNYTLSTITCDENAAKCRKIAVKSIFLLDTRRGTTRMLSAAIRGAYLDYIYSHIVFVPPQTSSRS